MIAFWTVDGDLGSRVLVEFLFWTAAIMLLYVYVGYPALLATIAVFCRRPKREPGYCPTLSVLIAARNEQGNIGRKIQQTLALDYPAQRLEVVVVSDASTDLTDSIVKASPDPRVRLLSVPQRRGKTYAQNRGVEQCHGEIIVFSDATTVYHPKALRYLACNYEDPQVGGVSGRYRYLDPEGESPTGLGSIAFWSYENLIKMLQSRISTLTGSSGCIYSVRRRLYTPLPEEACSDLVEPLWVVRQGYRVVFEDRALAYEETTKSVEEDFRMRVRIITQGLLSIFGMRELLNFRKYGWISFQLFSHKILRWTVPIFLILLFTSSAALLNGPFFLYLFVLQTLFYGLAVASRLVPLHRRWKPLGVPLYFCILNLAVLLSVIEVFKGNKYSTWERVRS